MAQHAIYIAFVFALGACVGSFLNVVVWRLPRVEHQDGEGVLRTFYRSYRALSWPPSHCPKCEKPLKWYDNLPVIGWLKLGGKCRFCKEPISPRYPIVEFITGAMFVLYYVMFFIFQIGPCSPTGLMVPRDLWIYFLFMVLASGLLAASLIDAELFIIPLEIPYVIAVIAFVVHPIFSRPGVPGALNLESFANALAAGGFVGLIISLILFSRGVIPLSFPDGEPILEVDRPVFEREIREAKRKGEDVPPLPPTYTPKQIRAEIRKEMLFLFPPMACAVLWMVLTHRVDAIKHAWESVVQYHWVTGLLGSILGALVGAWLVWIVRILGTLVFGRVAMGLGDVHLLFGVGAVIGTGPVVVAFFLAPFFGILLALYKMLRKSRQELPYGPYLSLGTAAAMLFYCPIADYFRPGLSAMMELLIELFAGRIAPQEHIPMWLKIKVWTKIGLFGLVFLYGLIFIFKNSDKTVDLWYWFGREPKWPVLYLTLGSFFTGVIVVILLRTTFVTLRQIRELQARGRSERLAREVESMKQKAASLRTTTGGIAGTTEPPTTPADPTV